MSRVDNVGGNHGANSTHLRQGNFSQGSGTVFADSTGKDRAGNLSWMEHGNKTHTFNGTFPAGVNRAGNLSWMDLGNKTHEFNGTFPDCTNGKGNLTWTHPGNKTQFMNTTFPEPGNRTHWQNLTRTGSQKPAGQKAMGAGMNQPGASSGNPGLAAEIGSLVAPLNDVLNQIF
jgi:hypothetical protein